MKLNTKKIFHDGVRIAGNGAQAKALATVRTVARLTQGRMQFRRIFSGHWQSVNAQLHLSQCGTTHV